MRRPHGLIAAALFATVAAGWHPFGASSMTLLALGLCVLALSPGRQ